MFNTARTKLTAWYILILMSVSIAFSVVIYRGMAMEVDRFSRLQRVRLERRFDEFGIPHPPSIDNEIIQEIKQHIILVLLGINGGILIVFGGLSYLLAGKTLSPIQEMLEEQNRFVSDASHELKTPITAMKSALEVYIRDPKLTLTEAKQVLRDNIEEVNRLQALSESLLTLSENGAYNASFQFTQLHLKDIITTAFNRVKHGADKKKIKVHITSLPDKKIKGNEEKLTELFSILFDNAVKYSLEETTISITGSLIKKGIEIGIVDKGIGIETKDLPHIFDRFYRSDVARSKSDVGGYGLGLSIAKKIIDNHKGEIHIESGVNLGTTVSVWLPLA